MSVLVGARPFTQLGGASGGTYQEMSKDRWNFAAGCARSRGSTVSSSLFFFLNVVLHHDL